MKIQPASAPKGLWRHPHFLKLWAGSTVSLFGSQITFLALPFTAVLLLHASAAQMSLLVFAETLPTLLIGPFAGVWVDRLLRRLALMVTDLGRALVLTSVPILALLGWLRIADLLLVAFLFGALTFCFDAAYGAFLPTLVERDLLIEGNSKLEVSNLLANLAGPALAGWLADPGHYRACSDLFRCALVSGLRLRGEHDSRPGSAQGASRGEQVLARAGRRTGHPAA